MKVHRYVAYIFMGAVCAVCMGVIVPVLSAQNSGAFHITQILQNDEDPSVVAFSVFGNFELNDVVNMYSDDVFIKSKPINTPELAGTGEVLVENISVDVFNRGKNRIVARVERGGVEFAETEPFDLTIQEPPSRPTIMVLMDKEQRVVVVDVMGSFEEGDMVKVFLNGSDLQSRTVSTAEIAERKARIAGISTEILRIGENYFEASIVRAEYESDRSERSEKIVIVPEEEVEEEPAENMETEEDPVLPIAMRCIEYGDPEKVTYASGEANEGFGDSLEVKDGVFAAGTNEEKVYIHNRSPEGWLFPTILTEQEGGVRSLIDNSIAVYDRDTVLVGHPNSWYREQAAGAVYMYKRYNSVWSNYMTIAPGTLDLFEGFGSDIALSDTLLAVSALRSDRRGVVYPYVRKGGSWVGLSPIIPRDTKPDQNFGHSISVSGASIAVGAPGDGTERSGAAYVYTKTQSGWYSEKIVRQNRVSDAQFGKEVLLHGDTLFVSADKDDELLSSPTRGVVYVYVRQSDGWYFAKRLRPDEEDIRGHFGESLAYSDSEDLLAVGAPESNVARDKAGAVYIFKQVGANDKLWERKKVLVPETVGRNDRFGSGIDFDGIHLFVGARGTDAGKKNTGAVYIYPGAITMCEDQEVPETEEVVTSLDDEALTLEEQEYFLGLLKKKKEVIDKLAERVVSLAGLLGGGIEDVYSSIMKQEDNIVIYDEQFAHEQAQRRAAEQRGVIGPQLPGEVAVIYAESANEIPAPPTSDTVRSRDAVVRETEGALGVTVPVTTKDLRLGDVHEEVYRLQVFLNQNGYLIARSGPGSPGNETSTFTKETDRALRSFQLVNGLSVTGVLDKETRGVIITFVSGTGVTDASLDTDVAQPGSVGADVGDK